MRRAGRAARRAVDAVRTATSLAALAVAAVLGLAGDAVDAGGATGPDEQTVARLFAFAGGRLTATAAAVPVDRYPITTRPDGSWRTTSASDWTSGFFPGALWLQYARTLDPSFRREAERRQAGIEGWKTRTTTHDLGFMFLSTYGNAYRLTGEDPYRQVVLTAAGSLAQRYVPSVGSIRSQN